MDKTAITNIFNRGFRRGANDRANRGLPLSSLTPPPSKIPDCPEGRGAASWQIAWTVGYATGYQVGASDAELSSVTVPATYGMVSEMSEQMLEKIGVFDKISNEV